MGRKATSGRWSSCDEPHVAEDVGVTREVDPSPVLQLDDEADGLADVARAGGRGIAQDVACRVVGMDHGHTDAPCVEGAALVHARHLIHAPGQPAASPQAQLVDAGPGRSQATGDAHGVADVKMVEVAMGDEEQVAAIHRSGRLRGRRVAEPGIEQDATSALGLDLEAASVRTR